MRLGMSRCAAHFYGPLSGHIGYAHMASLMGDRINTQILGLAKVVSDDSESSALNNIEVEPCVAWLQTHLQCSYEPLLKQSWILDFDVTVNPLCDHQKCAKVGYDPLKPGWPSQTYYTHLIANL